MSSEQKYAKVLITVKTEKETSNYCKKSLSTYSDKKKVLSKIQIQTTEEANKYQKNEKHKKRSQSCP